MCGSCRLARGALCELTTFPVFVRPSEKTASAHVAHIKNKLGVESRVEIAIAAIRLGLLEPLTAERG